MKISKRGLLLALSLSAVSARNTCSGQAADGLPAAMPDSAVHTAAADTADESSLRTAAEQAKASGKTAGAGAQRAANGALTAEANAATAAALCAEQEAKAAADIAFASTPNDPDAAAKAKAAADAAAKTARDAAGKAVAAHKAAIDALAPGDLKEQQAEDEAKLAAELSDVIALELMIVKDLSAPMNERVSAIEVLGSIAVSYGDLEIVAISPGETIASYVVRHLLDVSNGHPGSIAKFVVLADILSASGMDVVAGGKDAFKLAINEFYFSIQKGERRIQHVSSTALAGVLRNMSVDADAFLGNEFTELVKQVSDTITTHQDSHVRLGLLTALAQKGSSTLKQEQDVESASRAIAKAEALKQKLDAADAEAKAAETAYKAAEAAREASSQGVIANQSNIAMKDTEIANKKVELEDLKAPGSGATAQQIADQVKVVEGLTRQLDVLKRALALLKTAEDNAIAFLGAALEAKNAKDNAKSTAKAAYSAAKADAEAKSKAKPVAEEALPTVLAALRDLSSSSTRVDRVRIEARYALTQFLQGQLLPEPWGLKFTPGPIPTDRQPLAASDRPGVSTINTERMGVTHTRSFNAGQDVTNRAERGSRVAAPPQSLRIPGPDATFSSEPRAVRRADGATEVTGPAFEPGEVPKPVTSAQGITRPPTPPSTGP